MSGLPSVANGIAGIPDWQLMSARILKRLPSGRSTPGWAKARLVVYRNGGDYFSQQRESLPTDAADPEQNRGLR